MKVKFLGYIALTFMSVLALLAVAAATFVITLPDVTQLEKCMTTAMYKVRLCPGSSNYVKLKEISPFVIHAVIAAEDGSFYSHKGFDWHEIQASFELNLKTGHFRRGGSTLTQQLAKNVFLSKDKSLSRKLKEAYLAHAIERRYDKNFILEKYLNVVEFGKDIYGVRAAANHYFQKSPADLHPLEASFLAFLLPNPKSYSKSFRAGQLSPYARKMVGVILRRMASFGKLTPAALQTSMTELDSFPWAGLTRDSFSGSPTHELEATHTPGMTDELDQDSLERMMEEELNAGGGSSEGSTSSSDHSRSDEPEEESPSSNSMPPDDSTPEDSTPAEPAETGPSDDAQPFGSTDT